MKLTPIWKERIKITGGYMLFMILFWFLGKAHNMKPLTAFLGIGVLTGFYALLVIWIKKLLNKKLV